MLIVNHSVLPLEQHEGWHSRSLAGPALGCAALAVRQLVLEPGASLPAQAAAGVRILLVLAGQGKQRLDGEPQSFHAPCSLHVPARAEQQLVNSGATPLQLIEISALAPGAP
jgi:quercetin dioxygenase-like cupin family protein